jgi:predicted metal-dependent phosphoesterase TrpH
MTALFSSLARPKAHGRADLHMHSTSSDGKYSIRELVDLCARAGLLVMAVTDHDTLGSFGDLFDLAQARGVRAICGVEITATIHQKDIHILAYGLDNLNNEMNLRLEEVRKSRLERYLSILDRLEARGLSGLTAHRHEAVDTLKRHPGMALGRRNIAEILVSLKHVSSLRNAFDRYLKDPTIVGIPKDNLSATEVIRLVRNSGGITSWAHPPENMVPSLLPELASMGMTGLEAEYPDFKNSWTRKLRAMASDLGLLITGGSDCHGPGARWPGSTSIGGKDLDTFLEALP